MAKKKAKTEESKTKLKVVDDDSLEINASDAADVHTADDDDF